MQGKSDLVNFVEELKKEQDDSLKMVRFQMERVVTSMQEEINQLELRLDMKMKIIKDEVRRQAKLSLVLK